MKYTYNNQYKYQYIYTKAFYLYRRLVTNSDSRSTAYFGVIHTQVLCALHLCTTTQYTYNFSKILNYKHFRKDLPVIPSLDY